MRCGRESSSSFAPDWASSAREFDPAREWRASDRFPRRQFPRRPAHAASPAGCALRGDTRLSACLAAAILSGGHPLFGAQQLVVVAIGRQLRRQICVDLRRFRMFAVAHQACGLLLLVRRRLHRLDQAARGGNQRCHQGRAHDEPWTSSDHCHTLHSRFVNLQAPIIVTNDDGGAVVRGRHADRQFGRFERARARYAAKAAP